MRGGRSSQPGHRRREFPPALAVATEPYPGSLSLMELPLGQGGKEPMILVHEGVVVPEEPVFMSGSAPSIPCGLGVQVQDPERPLRGLTATQPGRGAGDHPRSLFRAGESPCPCR